MAIDLEKAVGAAAGSSTSTWTERDVVLYHLGLGAGTAPTSPRELAYAFETRRQVLPS